REARGQFAARPAPRTAPKGWGRGRRGCPVASARLDRVAVGSPWVLSPRALPGLLHPAPSGLTISSIDPGLPAAAGGVPSAGPADRVTGAPGSIIVIVPAAPAAQGGPTLRVGPERADAERRATSPVQ